MDKPEVINFPFKINFKKLWALDLPVEKLDIADLEFNFDIPYLEKEGTDDWNLSINYLIRHLDTEISHAEKIKKADMTYPIDIYFFKNNWIILDGVHRLAKALLQNDKSILVRRIPDECIPRIIR
jgi:hypothetical protein